MDDLLKKIADLNERLEGCVVCGQALPMGQRIALTRMTNEIVKTCKLLDKLRPWML